MTQWRKFRRGLRPPKVLLRWFRQRFRASDAAQAAVPENEGSQHVFDAVKSGGSSSDVHHDFHPQAHPHQHDDSEMPPIPQFTRKIVAVGDLHGDLPNAQSVLQMAGVVNSEGKWTGNVDIFVQTGDIIDR